jgi:hypothetical protein
MKLTSKQVYKVTKKILAEQLFTQRQISRETGVSVGYVNEIINYLIDIGVVARTTKGFILWDTIKFLEKISFDRPFISIEIDRFRLPTRTIQDTENEISNILQGKNYAFTVFSGLRRYFEYHIIYPMVHLYVEEKNSLDILEKGEGPIQIVVLRPDLENIMKEKKKINGTYVCDKEQVIIDLFSSGIGRDAAIKFLEAA